MIYKIKKISDMFQKMLIKETIIYKKKNRVVSFLNIKKKLA